MVAVQNTIILFICSLWWTNGLTAHSASFLPHSSVPVYSVKAGRLKSCLPRLLCIWRRIQTMSHQLDALVQGRNGAEDFFTPFGLLFFFFLLENIILDIGDLSKAGFQCLLEKQLWRRQWEVATSLFWLPDPLKVPWKSCNAGSLATGWWILLKISRGGLVGGNSPGVGPTLTFLFFPRFQWFLLAPNFLH